MQRLLFLYAMLGVVGLAQLAPVSGTINGTLSGEDGSTLQGATIVLHLLAKSAPRQRPRTTVWTSVAGTSGAFQFVGLPEGDYTLCPSLPNSTLLNPCAWGLPTPIATITSSNPTANIAVTLKRGAVVPIRIDDSAQLLAQHEGKTPGAGLLVQVSDGVPGSFFRRVPVVSQDSTGRDLQIVVPFNTPLTLYIHSTFYHVSDAIGVPLGQGATTRIPLVMASGQQIAPIKFTITGASN